MQEKNHGNKEKDGETKRRGRERDMERERKKDMAIISKKTGLWTNTTAKFS